MFKRFWKKNLSDFILKQDQTNNLNNHNGNTLSAVSSTLNRWAEEARVLDGDSVHDCITGN